MPVHTIGHVDCAACEASRASMMEPEKLARLPFPQAAQVWFESHSLHVGPGTVRHYKNCIHALSAFFSSLRLDQVHVGHFEQYQRMRSTGDGLPKAGPSCINHELNTMSQILARANLWAPVAANYKPLKLPRPTVGCAMADSQEKNLFRVASSNPRWKVTYCCALITANTTAGPNEIRHLKIMDIDLDPPAIRVEEGVKNEYRRRTIPLNQPAAWAIRELVKRATELGATEPEHYLLPHRARSGAKGFDFSRPISSWRGSWDKLRKAAGMPHLRLYDLRHHAITRLLEDENVSERTVIELAGHVSRAMLERYSHIRMKTKQDAVNALERKGMQNSQGAGLVLVKK